MPAEICIRPAPLSCAYKIEYYLKIQRQYGFARLTVCGNWRYHIGAIDFFKG